MIFDIETDGIYPTKIRCMSFQIDGMISSTTDYNEMRRIILAQDELVGHNIIRYDIPWLEHFLNIKIDCKVIDTLALSWYLYPDLTKHGLEQWGERLGVAKPHIDDWETSSIEDLIHRCQEDVKINSLLYNKQVEKLDELYNGKWNNIIKYLTFKLQCAWEAEKTRWKFDKQLCIKVINKFESEKTKIITNLTEVMPKVDKLKTVKKPSSLYKKDGSISVRGQKWIDLVKQTKSNPNIEEITYVHKQEEPNPDSNSQVKNWLFSLGWKPATHKYTINVKGEKKKVEQVRVNGELCPSVVLLEKKEPNIKYLKNLSVINHRLGILKGYLRDEKDDTLAAKVAGLTNTLRFRHMELVNIPKVNKTKNWDDGIYIRSLLVSRDNMILCGSDMASLEDRTKQHYMQPLDPEYVKEMMTEGFDPHLSLAEFAGAMTSDEVQAYKNGDHSLKGTRHLYKTANYACIYGVGAEKLSKTLGITKAEAADIIKAYWGKNWSVKKVAESMYIKRYKDEMWLKNPLNGFYYSLRYEKDIFSTLNQGTATFCFDIWVGFIRKLGYKLSGQFHDEVIIEIPKGKESQCKEDLYKAIDQANKYLKLNIELDIDVQFGDNYAKIH